MPAQKVSRRDVDNLIECLAAIEHERWSHWQRYMHGKSTRNPDGSLVVPPDLAMQWERQMNAGYHELSEGEKQSDRDQVNRYLPIILSRLGLDVE